MTAKRDTLFPSTSIGRSPSPTLSVQRTASHDSLSAHPLLSSSPSFQGTPESATGAVPAPRYVPYTPRQRTAATTGTTVTQPFVAAPAQQHPGDARSRLQLMSLKAAAQNISLDTASIGWAILEKLVEESEHGAEWAPVWEALLTSKATLLLPLEPATNEPITAEFVKDHVVLCDGQDRDDANIITLSGLRGRLSGNSFVIRSSLSPTSKAFQALLSPSTRSSTLKSLPPLPTLPSTPSVSYPKFTVPNYSTSLPLPPRPLSVKPPLPPRPSARSSPLQATSRLPNPFSFFAKPAATTTPTATPPTSIPVESEHAVEIPAFTIDRRIVLKEVSKTLTKALRAELKDALSGAPSWVIDRVQTFTAGLQPLVRSPKQRIVASNTSSGASTYMANPLEDLPEDISRDFQDFYATLEEDLRTGGSPTISMRRSREETRNDDEKERERRARAQISSEAKIRELLETVERAMTHNFYDRLFSPAASDDSSHDEALSSRIVALNQVELGLEHLGVDVGKAGADVQSVVMACGEMLSTLAACQSPADKGSILVAAHKVVVDGLARLPPIRLKSDAEVAGQETPKSASASNAAVEEKPEPPALVTENTAKVSSPLVLSPVDLPSVTSPGIDSLAASAEPTRATSPEPSSSASLNVRPSSPLLTISPPPERENTPVSGDVLLPLIIFAVAKTNPPRLVSELLFTQRYRNQSTGGEESYCLINLMAVAEFLENVDLGALGLGESEKKVPSTADLTPIPLSRTAIGGESPHLPPVPAGLRGRVEQQVDAIAGSANKVLSGVVDSSFGVLRSFLPGAPENVATPSANELQSAAPWNTMRPAFGLLRRESGFSIASLAASLPGAGGRERAKSINQEENHGQQMVEVSSRPGSRMSSRSIYAPVGESSSEDEGSGSEDEEDSDLGEDDARSVRSFSSMMSNRRNAVARKSLSDRLANSLGRLAGQEAKSQAQVSPPASRRSSMLVQEPKKSPPPSRRSSLLPPPHGTSPTVRGSLLPPVPSSGRESPGQASSREASPVRPALSAPRLAPPIPRFLDCDPDDLRVAEVRALLQDYRRLVTGLRAMGGFED